jgi:hypothetical protein
MVLYVNLAPVAECNGDLTEQMHLAWLLSLAEVEGKLYPSEYHRRQSHSRGRKDGCRVFFPPE